MMKKISSFLCAAAIAFSGVPAAISAPQTALTVFAEDQPENGEQFTEGALTFWVIRESDERLGLWLKECDPKAEAEKCTVPESVKGLPVTTVNAYAFNECKNLKEIVIPDSVTEINEWAFFGCSSLTKVRLPKNLTVLENDLFHGCSALETVEIPETVTKISGFAFCNCTNLSSLTLPENLEAIGYNAFLNTPSLTKLTIPKSVKEIDPEAFPRAEDDQFSLCVYKDSYALEYAVKNGIRYVVIDGEQPPVTAPVTGDADGDGEITVTDAQNVLTAYAEVLADSGKSSLSGEKKAACDVDGDGRITAADAQYILIYYTENNVAGNPVTWEALLTQGTAS